jgi:membrane-associated protease RseP (regulator of RpoE activity)
MSSPVMGEGASNPRSLGFVGPGASSGGSSSEQGGRSPTQGSPWAAFVRLVVVLALGVAAAVVFHGLAVLVVVLALVVMVMMHELGHFVAAKASGMKVTEYFVGFGPRLWSARLGETEYGVKAFPVGGYVKIVGMTALEEVAPEDEPRSYRQASFPRRLAVALAGSTMHFVMAFLLLWAMFAVTGMPVGTTAQIASVAHFANTTSPAARAGLKPGDVLVAVDGHRYDSANQLIEAIKAHPNEVIRLGVLRGGHSFTVQLRPVDGRKAELRTSSGALKPELPAGKGPDGVIGVSVDVLARDATVGPLLALGRAGSMLGSLTAQTGEGIAQVFSLHGLGTFAHEVAVAGQHAQGSTSSSSSSSSRQVLSILGAVQVGAQAASRNVSELLYILVAINIFVGMVNLFPMLPLDGGHVAIAIYERARSRRGRAYHADVAKLLPVAYVFLAFMLLFGLGALYMNIVQPARLPGG